MYEITTDSIVKYCINVNHVVQYEHNHLIHLTLSCTTIYLNCYA